MLRVISGNSAPNVPTRQSIPTAGIAGRRPEELFREICLGLIGIGGLTKVAADNIAPVQQFDAIVPRLVNDEGVDPDAVAQALSQRLNMPLYDPDSHGEPEHRNSDWLLVDGTAFIFNPFGESMRSLHEEHRGDGEGKWGIQEFGVVALRYLGQEVALQSTAGRYTLEVDRLLQKIFHAGFSGHCSDIHLDPYSSKEARVYYRRDGVLGYGTNIDLNVYLNVANVLLEKSGNTAGVFTVPVDGQFDWPMGSRTVDVRLVMLPARVGSRVYPKFVLRLLGQDLELRDLDKLHIPQVDLDKLREVSRRASGMMLVTGPTGSGKTTTLIALLRDMVRRRPDRKYYTLEDPVEIVVPGLTQVEIKEGVGFTWETGLRRLLRADPDVALVGEIRDDKESAAHALRLALTGHLVLSTIHAGTALGAIPRMLDLNVNPVLLSTTLVAVAAQRMVRKVCKHCGTQVPFGANERWVSYYADIPQAPKETDEVWVASNDGCEKCNNGYLGRQILIEVVNINRKMARMIAAEASEYELEEYVQTKGHYGLWDRGMGLVKAGVTTIDELERQLDPQHVEI